MRGINCGLALLCVLAIAAAVGSAEPGHDAEGKKLSVWMDVKVEESQKIFVALAQADFETIADSAEKLTTLSALEGFVRRSTPGYRTQLRSFEFAVAEIQQQAKRENIEGVTLGFNQLTLSCVNCHKELRRPAQGTPVPAASDSDESKR